MTIGSKTPYVDKPEADYASLNDLLKLQARFMLALGINPGSGTMLSSNKASQTEMGAAIGITVESAEILEVMEKANRVWKPESHPFEHAREELIDVLFFVLELALLFDLNGEDLSRCYLTKYKTNLLRALNASASMGTGINGQLVTLMDDMFGEAETERLIREAIEKKEK